MATTVIYSRPGTGGDGTPFPGIEIAVSGCAWLSASGELREISEGLRNELGIAGAGADGARASLADVPLWLREVAARVAAAPGGWFNEELILASSNGTPRRYTIMGWKPNGLRGDLVLTMLGWSGAPGSRDCAERLQHLERLANLGTLSVSSAHEIKNALVAVKTFVDLLVERNPGMELAGIVGKELARIESLIMQTLDYASPARPVMEDVHLHEIVDFGLRLLRSQFQKKSIICSASLKAQRDVVRGNPEQLQQAVINLLLNALESLHSGGRLDVFSRGGADGSGIELEVQDSGPGIPADLQERIFEPFFTTKHGGTGLGLYITRQIIKQHGGSIGLRSGPGVGTTFVMRFPSPAAT